MAKASVDARARLIFEPGELAYDFGPAHPLQQGRLVALMDLLETARLWQRTAEQTNLPMRPATLEELALAHTSDYIAAVQRLSAPPERENQEEQRGRLRLALKYGFAESDTPPLPGMHEAAARIVGGSLVALSAVMGLLEGGVFGREEERPLHVFHPAGGLTHVLPPASPVPG